MINDLNQNILIALGAGFLAGAVCAVLVLCLWKVIPEKLWRKNEKQKYGKNDHKIEEKELNALLRLMERQQETNDLTLRLGNPSETRIGRVAQRYNHLMESLEEVISKARAIVQSSKDAIFTCSLQDLKIASLNRAAEKMFQARYDELLGLPFLSLIEAPEAKNINEEEFLEKLILGKWKNLEGKGLKGNTFPIEVSIAKVMSARNSFLTVTVHDITNHEKFKRKAEDRAKELEGINKYLMDTKSAMLNIMEELEEEKKKGRLILDSAGEGIFGLDNLGKVTFINPCGLKILGYNHETEIIGFDQHERIHYKKADGNPFPKSDCKIIKSINRGMAIQSSDETFVKKDGSLINVQYSCTPILENGAISGAVFTFNDITEQKRLETQLAQSQKMEGIGRLAGGVAHDFNNLLTVMSGYCEILLNSKKPASEQTELLQEIRSAVTRATSLTSQLLAFSRRQVMAPRPVNLNELISNMEKMLRRIIVETVELDFDISEKDCYVKVDPSQIEQVVLNLAVNAMDAIDKNGKIGISVNQQNLEDELTTDLLDVTGRPAVPPGNYTILTVSDTGCGMDENIKRHMLDPFFTTKKQGKGTGLGLSTAYGIIKQSNGFMKVETAPGKGTVFTVFLPALKGEVKTITAEEKTRLSIPYGKETVLLVEDETALRKLVSRSLLERGYEVHEALNGLDAIAKADALGKKKIDLLLTDVVMPKMGGKELDNKLHALRPEMKTIFMSGYTEDQDLRERLGDKGVYFLQKPFNPSQLCLKVREALDGKKIRAEIKRAA